MKTLHFTLISFFILLSSLVFSQQNNVGINTTTPDPSAALEVVSKNNNQGILIPRLTTTQRTGITTPASGLLVYDSTTKSFWFFDGTNWVDIGAIVIPSKIEDADMDTAVETFEGGGSTDEVNIKIDGTNKFKFIDDRLEADNFNGNLFVGLAAGKDNTGSGNTFLGNSSGEKNNTGFSNTFVGNNSGTKNTLGNANVFLGQDAGIENTIGTKNTFLGRYAGPENKEGGNNIFIGYSAGESIVSGGSNIFIGNQSDLGNDVSNKLVIENNFSTTPLIYGEFDNHLLRVNGTFNINNAFSFPTSDGTANQILATDGSGTLSWTTPSASGSSSKIEDTDMDTSVEAIDGAGATDLIEFTVNGVSAWEMTKDRLEETNASDNIFIGKTTGNATTTATESVFIGTNAGTSNATGNANVYLGKDAGASNVAGTTNVYVGHSAGTAGGAGSNNTFLGGQAGALVTGSNNTYVGQLAGGGASSDGEGNVFLGFNAGQFETGDNKLFIENSNSPDPLIYGDFSTDLLRVNGTLNINQAFSFPIADGTANQVLATDGSGNVAWSTPTAATPSKIEDTDMDTSVEAIDGAGATDKIEFKVDNDVQWRMVTDRIEPENINDNLFIGKEAGQNDVPIPNTNIKGNTFVGNFSGKNNTYGRGNSFFGYSAGSSQTNGHYNTSIGRFAGSSNSQGYGNTFIGADSGLANESAENTMIGSYAGQNNINGSGNVFLGYAAGYNELGNHKLYIENTSSSSPLIYGEFDNDLLRINGTLNVNNAFSLPTVDGTANQILATDGSGNVSWTTPSSGGSSSSIEDSDSNTKIETDESGDDAIHFYTPEMGLLTERWVMKKDRLEEGNLEENIFIGKNAGNLNNSLFGIYNTFIGTNTGKVNVGSANNTYIGKSAGENNLDGENTFVGARSGELVQGGTANVYMGYQTGKANVNGDSNLMLGTAAGETMTAGDGNVILGANAAQLTSGSGNVIIGNNAWSVPPTGVQNNKLIIDNDDSTAPLIWGDFSTNLIGINRIATTNTLEVEGEASKTTAGSWVGNSDARLKKNIENLNSEEILQKLLQLQGVNYEWNDTQTGAKRPEGKQYGFIAQNIQNVFPELVKEDNLGYLQTAYGTYDAMQIEALRALLNRIEKLENENQELKTVLSDIETIKTELAELKGIAKK